MFKKFLVSSMGLALFLTGMSTAFADDTISTISEVNIEEVTIEGGGMESSTGYYDPGYYGNNISFSLYLNSSATPQKISLSGDYSVNAGESREAVMKELKSALSQAQKSLGQYGKVTMTGMSAYENYAYEMDGVTPSEDTTYNGYLSVTLDLTNPANIEGAKNALTSMNFNYWVNATLDEEDKIDIEDSLATKINTLIAKKKSVYEKILGSDLGRATSLYVDTWADGTQYDPATGKVPVSVTVTVGYMLQ